MPKHRKRSKKRSSGRCGAPVSASCIQKRGKRKKVESDIGWYWEQEPSTTHCTVKRGSKAIGVKGSLTPSEAGNLLADYARAEKCERVKGSAVKGHK